jgi:hypothetical protein
MCYMGSLHHVVDRYCHLQLPLVRNMLRSQLLVTGIRGIFHICSKGVYCLRTWQFVIGLRTADC